MGADTDPVRLGNRFGWASRCEATIGVTFESLYRRCIIGHGIAVLEWHFLNYPVNTV